MLLVFLRPTPANLYTMNLWDLKMIYEGVNWKTLNETCHWSSPVQLMQLKLGTKNSIVNLQDRVWQKRTNNGEKNKHLSTLDRSLLVSYYWKMFEVLRRQFLLKFFYNPTSHDNILKIKKIKQ